MLSLKQIVKNYISGDETVQALKGIDIEFRENEFVSILGPSGCGKTTLLNIIGGLDRYTSGDLVINGKSTKEFKDSDWDTYRNHSVGFVFQSYNLIPHQTVLSNVELALTLSGVSKSERRKRAIDVLTKVGLSDQLNKKPNQMSGGQMQRVAIARALINDPDILLADEPTGALDSATSVQIMEILKEISKDKLIIMVTHNPELAEKYSSRIVRLLDGKITDDSDPYSANVVEPIKNEEKAKADSKKGRKTSMSFLTALSLSKNNLLTKKARTILTSFAGSIGIIGIALILSLSNGVQTYINAVQEDTLSTYPLTIDETTTDLQSMMEVMMDTDVPDENRPADRVYSRNSVGAMINAMSAGSSHNNLKEFKTYLESKKDELEQYTSDIKYSYSTVMNIYKENTDDEIIQVNPSQIYEAVGMGSQISDMESSSIGSMSPIMASTANMWSEIIDNQDILDAQYDVIAGRMPESYDEIVVVVNEYNEIDDFALYSLGLKDVNELSEMMSAMQNMDSVDESVTEYSYDEILDLRYRLILNTDYYKKDGSRWVDMSGDEEYMKSVIENGIELKVVGILRPNEEASAESISGVVGYRSDLMKTLIEKINDTEIVKAQLADPETDIFTGLKFEEAEEKQPADREEMLAILGYDQLSDDEKTKIDALSDEQLAEAVSQLSAASEAEMSREEMLAAVGYDKMSDEEKAQIDAMTDQQLSAMIGMMQQAQEESLPEKPETTYEENLSILGVASLDTPSSINIYPKDFASKESIENIIKEYNEKAEADGHEENIIQYTDMVGLMMSSVTSIIDAISYVLIGFVAISLIVSSIMIGIITYISVLERTKEIGILRSIGASKKDISRVFNAETIIVGFTAGAIGIAISYLLTIPINMIISHLTDAPVRAAIPVAGAVILIIISMLLTFIAGLIPSRIAAKKDPVVALRTE
ncbi:ABC transporter ATP-binding protein/permease [Ruminococcus sp. Marseille-P6503]|uniref:ABC transporter ATP-binding protein/permease n=1 Tax=Ruminococcus sp. Marseille-P6503 TaxID=2364796 RepID=UPI000F54AA06|nr:ABC transporter ATP-binding protein/permease [Ruminococcus sp. Marseille-P6503]